MNEWAGFTWVYAIGDDYPLVRISNVSPSEADLRALVIARHRQRRAVRFA